MNINKGHNEKLMKSCQALQDYAEYVNMVRENRLSGADLNAAVEKALDEAVKRNLLNGYFNRHRARIKAMSLTEYDEEEAKKVFHDDGYNEGRAEGMAQGMAQGRAEGMAQGMAAQKSEDENIIQKITEEKDAEIVHKDAELVQKDAEIEQKDAEIARLKAMISGK